MSLGNTPKQNALELPPEDAPLLYHRRRPTGDLLRDLAQHLRLERRRAVDPEELAAILEDDGYTDDLIRENSSLVGIFDSAEQIYALKIGKRAEPPQPAALRVPWRLLWRGPLLLLMALGLISTQQGLEGAGTGALAVTGVAAWGLGVRLFWQRRTAQQPGLLHTNFLAGYQRVHVLLGAVLGVVLGTLQALWSLAMTASEQVSSGLILGAVLGGLYGLTLTSGWLLWSLGQWQRLVQLFGGAALLSEIWRLIAATDPAALVTVSVSLLLMLACSSAFFALQVATTASLLSGMPRLNAALLKSLLSTESLWPAAYGWASALVFALLAWRLEAAALLLPLLLFGLLEVLAWRIQARLRQLAKYSSQAAALIAAARLPLFGAAALVLGLFAVLGVMIGQLGWLAVMPLTCTVGVALLSTALLLSNWLSRHQRLPGLTLLWLISAALLAVPMINWWLPVLLLSLVVLLMCDDVLSDLSSYR